ncbi:MAG: hypothetical protein AAFU67_07445, partial [Bacteroidota bacterium]
MYEILDESVQENARPGNLFLLGTILMKGLSISGIGGLLQYFLVINGPLSNHVYSYEIMWAVFFVSFIFIEWLFALAIRRKYP